MNEQRSPEVRKVTVVGGSGFIGSAVLEALRRDGLGVESLSAPRIINEPDTRVRDELVDRLARDLMGADCCINAAGLVGSSTTQAALAHANATLPGLLAQATMNLGIRFIHISSGATQGRLGVLDSNAVVKPFTPYAESKAAGEREVAARNPASCIYRPPGVHGIGRSTTRRISRIAQSPLAFVASPGTANSPQAHVLNVADAVRFLATIPHRPPPIVHHPSESITTAELLFLLGGKQPRTLPAALARGMTQVAYAAARVRPSLIAQVRQIEVILLGQEQAPSWLTEAGWTAPFGRAAWQDLASHHT